MTIANGVNTIATVKMTVPESIPNHKIAMNNQPIPEKALKKGVSLLSTRNSVIGRTTGKNANKPPRQKAMTIAEKT